MPYFPDLVRYSTPFPDGALWLYLGDTDGDPRFRYDDNLTAGATIEARDEARQAPEDGESVCTLAELLRPTTTDRFVSLAGNDVMLDTEGRLYLWAGRRSGESGVSAWWQVAPEDADLYRATRDRALSSGEYLVHIMSRAQWERGGVREHGPVTFTDPEPSIPAPVQPSSAAYYLAPATTTTGGSYPRQALTITADSVTFTPILSGPATVTPVEPPAEAVLVADGGYLFVPAGQRDDQPVWRPFNTQTAPWRVIRDRHADAYRARTTTRRGGNRDTFAGWSERLPTVRVLTPADLPPDLVDGRGRRWLHVGWHEGPRYRLAEGGRRPPELERRDLMASCPDSGFNVGRAWTRDRIERVHGGVTERPRLALPYFLVGSGETAVAPGTPAAVQHRDGNPRNNEVGNLTVGPTVVLDPAAGVRPGDTPTAETYQERYADWCPEEGPRGSYRCSRRPGHVGHHVAAHSTRVVAVWTDREHYLPEFGGGNITREEYTAHLHARGIVAPGETFGEATPSGSMIAAPDPVERALAELESAEQAASAYRDQVRDRAIRGYTSDREYPSPAAVNVSLRNLHLPEYKIKYRAKVIVEFDVETDDRDAARRVAADMARPLSNVTPTEGVSSPVTASVWDLTEAR